MNIKYCTLLALFALLMALQNTAAARTFISDPKLPDTVRVDSVRALRSSQVIVPINVYIDEPLSGMEITLTSSSPAVTLDSFSFQGGIVDYIQLKGAIFVDRAVTVYAFPYSDFFIYAAHGLFGRVYASVSDTASSGSVLIDSTTIIIELVEHSTTFSDLNLQVFVPQYRPGKVQIEDSCCIGLRGNIDASTDDGVDISDLTAMISYLFLDFGYRLPCPEEADVVPDAAVATVDISDLTRLVQFLFIDASVPLFDCQTRQSATARVNSQN